MGAVGAERDPSTGRGEGGKGRRGDEFRYRGDGGGGGGEEREGGGRNTFLTI